VSGYPEIGEQITGYRKQQGCIAWKPLDGELLQYLAPKYWEACQLMSGKARCGRCRCELQTLHRAQVCMDF